MQTTKLDDTDFHTLANICEAAAERFKDNAKALPDQPRLADQFKLQAAQAAQYASLFYRAELITVVADDE